MAFKMTSNLRMHATSATFFGLPLATRRWYWNYEGSPFNAFPLLFGVGTCAVSQVPVWRAFNGGPQRGIESNHRFNTDKSAIDGMVSQGWIAEGIAFCVDEPVV